MKIPKSFFIPGLILIAAGVILNEWFISLVFTPDGVLNTIHRLQIWIFDIAAISVGSVLAFPNKFEYKVLRWISLGLVCIPVLLLLAIFIWRIQFKISIDYNEGWNAYYCNVASNWQALYNTHHNWTSVNYPPVSFYLVGIIGKITGDQLIAGRLVSMISMLLICIGVGYIVRKLSGYGYDGTFAGIYCLGLFVAYAPHYTGMNDPQMLAQILAVGGLLIYIKDHTRIFLIALLCSLSLFTKHSIVAIPFAITLDIFMRFRKDMFKWIIYFTLVSGTLFLMTMILSDREFLDQISAGRSYSSQKMLYWLLKLGKGLLIPAILALPWMFFALKKDNLRIIPFYFIPSVLIGSYFSGGSGTDVNMFFDLFIAISLITGILFSYFRSVCETYIKKSHQVSFILSVILGVSLLPGFLEQRWNIASYLQSPQQEKAFLDDINFLKSKQEPVLCEEILLCYYADKTFVFDLFLIHEEILLGTSDEKQVLNLIENGYFKVVQLNYQIPESYQDNLPYTSIQHQGRITENILHALSKYYFLSYNNGNSIYFYEPEKANGTNE